MVYGAQELTISVCARLLGDGDDSREQVVVV